MTQIESLTTPPTFHEICDEFEKWKKNGKSVPKDGDKAWNEFLLRTPDRGGWDIVRTINDTSLSNQRKIDELRRTGKGQSEAARDLEYTNRQLMAREKSMYRKEMVKGKMVLTRVLPPGVR